MEGGRRRSTLPEREDTDLHIRYVRYKSLFYTRMDLRPTMSIHVADYVEDRCTKVLVQCLLSSISSQHFLPGYACTMYFFLGGTGAFAGRRAQKTLVCSSGAGKGGRRHSIIYIFYLSIEAQRTFFVSVLHANFHLCARVMPGQVGSLAKDKVRIFTCLETCV